MVAKRRKPGPSAGRAISGVPAEEKEEEDGEEMEEEDKSRRRSGDADRVSREVMMREKRVETRSHFTTAWREEGKAVVEDVENEAVPKKRLFSMRSSKNTAYLNENLINGVENHKKI